MKKTILVSMLVVVLLLIAACSGEQELPAPIVTDPVNGDNGLDEEGVVIFNVIGGPGFEYYIDGERNPDMVVNVGDAVRVVLEIEGGMPHDWVVDEFDGAATRIISSGDVDVIEFVAGQPGEYEYYCSVGAHRANGMVGRFIVE